VNFRTLLEKRSLVIVTYETAFYHGACGLNYIAKGW
jgi:hypothetical protein